MTSIGRGETLRAVNLENSTYPTRADMKLSTTVGAGALEMIKVSEPQRFYSGQASLNSTLQQNPQPLSRLIGVVPSKTEHHGLVDELLPTFLVQADSMAAGCRLPSQERKICQLYQARVRKNAVVHTGQCPILLDLRTFRLLRHQTLHTGPKAFRLPSKCQGNRPSIPIRHKLICLPRHLLRTLKRNELFKSSSCARRGN